jgi:hypothetical protein
VETPVGRVQEEDTMKRVLAIALIAMLLLPGIASAGSSTDAALGLGAFAALGTILLGAAVLGHPAIAAPAPVVVEPPAPPVVYAPAPPVVYAPPPVVYVPGPRVVYAPPPPPVVYAPPRVYSHRTYARHGYAYNDYGPRWRRD